MAEVIPFRGILYNPRKIKNLRDVITPPFDVISKKEQHQFYERSPFNVVRLILGKTSEFDTRGHNPHSRAADYYNKGQYDKAISDCNKAIRINPKFADAYYNRALAYDRKGYTTRLFLITARP